MFNTQRIKLTYFLLYFNYYISRQIVPIQEKNSSGNTSRSMAAISLGFIVMVTPWTIQEIVTACTGSKVSFIASCEYFGLCSIFACSYHRSWTFWLPGPH